jgi:hypothetical protein
VTSEDERAYGDDAADDGDAAPTPEPARHPHVITAKASA